MPYPTTIAVFLCLCANLYAHPDGAELDRGNRQGLIAIAGIVAMGVITVAWVATLRRQVRSQTEQIRARLEREAHLEAQYRDLFESASDAVFTLNEHGLVLAMNHAGKKLTGLNEGDSFLNVAAPTSLVAARELIGSRAAATREISLAGAIGIANVEISVTPITSGGVQAIARDLTQRKRAEADLLQTQKMEAIGRLAGGVAHDFNNLLTVINGNAEVLRTRLHHDDDHALIEEILRAGEQAAAVTRQLLTYSRKGVVAPKVLSPSESIANVRTVLARLVGERVQIVTELDPEAGQVKIDPNQFEQVLVNLAMNARDSMSRGGTLTIRTQRHLKQVRIEVIDTGTGMDRATMAHLFEPFFSSKPAGEGTGLGLATVRSIVEQAGGTVSANNEPDRGTRFTIDLPRVDETAVSAVGSTVPPVLAAGKRVILLVEDEPAVQLLERRVLEMGKFEVIVASSGEEALRLLDSSAKRIDLLVTDVVMPGMSGRELAKRIQSRLPHLPVLFLSGYTPDEMLKEDVRADEVNFLQKPFTPSALLAQVRALLARSPVSTRVG